jgi:hypothetical protein
LDNQWRPQNLFSSLPFFKVFHGQKKVGSPAGSWKAQCCRDCGEGERFVLLPRPKANNECVKQWTRPNQVERVREEKGDWWPRINAAEQPVQTYGTDQPAALIPIRLIAILMPRRKRDHGRRSSSGNIALVILMARSSRRHPQSN